MIVAVAEAVGLPRVALSGGCFQNRLLLERALARLRAAGFSPYWHQRVPPNDGGIALGQDRRVRARPQHTTAAAPLTAGASRHDVAAAVAGGVS